MTQLVSSDLAGQLRQKIKQMLIDLIPAETMDKLIADEMKDLLEDHYFPGVGQTQKAGIRRIIKAELEIAVKQRVHEWLTKNVEQVWTEGDTYKVVSDAMLKLVPEIQQAMVEGMISQALRALRTGQ